MHDLQWQITVVHDERLWTLIRERYGAISTLGGWDARLSLLAQSRDWELIRVGRYPATFVAVRVVLLVVRSSHVSQSIKVVISHPTTVSQSTNHPKIWEFPSNRSLRTLKWWIQCKPTLHMKKKHNHISAREYGFIRACVSVCLLGLKMIKHVFETNAQISSTTH